MRETFAPGASAQWESAVNDLREIFHTLDDTNFDNREDQREAEEALFQELPEVDLALRDAWDDRME